ncbi:MAG: sigma-70 family RNA polymerase sigma factor [Pirellulaceae bacterium]
MSQSSASRLTSPSLILRIQCHDQDAWQQLTQLYGPLVFHWCKRLGLQGEDAADVFQDVFLSVSQSIGKFKPDTSRSRSLGSFRGWLWTITRNKALDRFRHGKGRAVAEGGTLAQWKLAELPDPFTDESAEPSDRSATTSLMQRGLKLIEAEFERKTWQAFWRSAVDEQPTSVIAEDLQLSQASVRQAKSRVLRRLRQVLGDV